MRARSAPLPRPPRSDPAAISSVSPCIWPDLYNRRPVSRPLEVMSVALIPIGVIIGLTYHLGRGTVAVDEAGHWRR